MPAAREEGDGVRYALHIFPQFADMAEIERVRERHDPLHGLIPPHVTLIFRLRRRSRR